MCLLSTTTAKLPHNSHAFLAFIVLYRRFITLPISLALKLTSNYQKISHFLAALL